MSEVQLARISTRVAVAVPVAPATEPPFDIAGVVVGFEHVITPGRWISTLHTTTRTRSY